MKKLFFIAIIHWALLHRSLIQSQLPNAKRPVVPLSSMSAYHFSEYAAGSSFSIPEVNEK